MSLADAETLQTLRENRKGPRAERRTLAAIARQKVFGPAPIQHLNDAECRAILGKAHAMRDEHRKNPGAPKITRAVCDVLAALLFKVGFNRTGACFPSYETIAEKARCARSTAGRAIKELEAAGLLTWIHRLKRGVFHWTDMLGQERKSKVPVRTSNGYTFGKLTLFPKSEKRTAPKPLSDPLPSKSADLTKPPCPIELQDSLKRLFGGIMRKASG